MYKLKKINNFIVNNHNHIFALILLFIYYILSLIIFKQVTINPHDNLDHLVVYDHIIGKIYNGDLDAANYFLSGNLKWFYIENIFYPTNLLHLILDNKQYYFTIEVLKKLVSYFAFYILAKSIRKNKFHSSVSALFYASIVNLENLFGFGIVMMPYFFYLLIKKKKLKAKHFFIIIFTGLNSSLVQDYLALCLLIPASFLIKQSINNLKTVISYFASISISMMISSLPIIFSLKGIKETHRLNFEIPDYSLELTDLFNTFFNFFSVKALEELFLLPLLFLCFVILILSITSNKKKLVFLTFFLIIVFTASLIINPFFKNIIFQDFMIFMKGYNFQRIDRIIPLIMSTLIVYNLNLLNNLNFKKLIYFLTIFTVITIQISYPIRETGKQFLQKNLKKNKYLDFKKNFSNNISFLELTKFLTKKNNYQNNSLSFSLSSKHTFDNYYRFEVYSFIKSIVKEERVMSVGIDPMIAVMNNIKAIDGYHTIYPMEYKIKFRKIIADELKINNFLKNYYDKGGNRVYAFYNDSNELLINFKAAKAIGANFVISAFLIKNVNLELICHNCRGNKDIFLYKIL